MSSRSPNKIEKIFSGGVTAYCTHCVVAPYLEMVYLLCISGFQMSVKTIVANFMQRRQVAMEIDNEVYYIGKGGFSYTVQQHKLPSGAFQSIVLPRHIADPQPDDPTHYRYAFFTGPNESTQEDIAKVFMQYCHHNLELPLDQSWAGSLWEYCHENDVMVEDLDTLVGNIRGFLINWHDETRLQNYLKAELKNGNFDFLGCFSDENGHKKGE